MLARAAVFIYGIFCYAVFLASFFYALGFVGDLYVPESIDSGAQGAPPAALLWSSACARARRSDDGRSTSTPSDSRTDSSPERGPRGP